MHHPKLPQTLRLRECPMRVLRDPEVIDLLTAFGRWQGYRVLPRAGGLEAQRARDLEAFDVMGASLHDHHAPTED